MRKAKCSTRFFICNWSISKLYSTAKKLRLFFTGSLRLKKLDKVINTFFYIAKEVFSGFY